MAKYKVTDTQLTAIADAIREKGGTNSSLAFPAGFVSAIGAIQTSSNEPIEEKDVNFIDYDGTLVASKTKAEINAMSSNSDLPSNPTHSGLTAQGWNWTVVQLKAQLAAMPDQKVYVGQMYTTSSGATEIDVIMNKGRLSPILTVCANGTISVDWGDNTTPDSVTGTSISTRLAVSHTYASGGAYTIKISKTSGQEYGFYGSSAILLLRQNTSVNNNKVYANCITNIRLGNDITTIGSNTFFDCFSLTNITIPNTITSIENNAFQYCYNLTSVTIPSNVTIIANGLFYGCRCLKSIMLPGGITTIQTNAFGVCDGLAKITIPYGVTNIGQYIFYNSGYFQGVTIPSGITKIDAYTFYSCYNLVNIIIPNNITSIEERAFYDCQSLRNIVFSDNITKIGNNAFYNCYSLANITIPNKVTSIGNSAFQNCYSLGTVTISSNVTSIGSSAFQACYGVGEYHFQPETPPTIQSNTFTNIQSDCIIYVPKGKLNDYQTASIWSNYASYMQEEPE